MMFMKAIYFDLTNQIQKNTFHDQINAAVLQTIQLLVYVSYYALACCFVTWTSYITLVLDQNPVFESPHQVP